MDTFALGLPSALLGGSCRLRPGRAPCGRCLSIAQGGQHETQCGRRFGALGARSFSRRLRRRDGLGRGRGDPGRGHGRCLRRLESLWTADWATGGEFVFDVDRDVCDVIGSSFAYVDLPAGVHSISASDIKKFPGGFQIGKYLTMVRIVEGKTTFARIDPVPSAPALVTLGGPMVRLVVVGNTRAEEEMAKLPLDTHVASFSCKLRAAEDRGT